MQTTEPEPVSTDASKNNSAKTDSAAKKTTKKKTTKKRTTTRTYSEEYVYIIKSHNLHLILGLNYA